MEFTPLEYATPRQARPYHKPAFYSLLATVIQLPIEYVLLRLPLPEWVCFTLCVLTWGLATAYALRTWWWLEPRRRRYRGLWIAGLALLADIFWLLCLLSAPV